MANPITFPTSLTPTARSYQPGEFPSTDFESLNGTKTHIRYGNKRVNSTMTLQFSGITDAEAVLILQNYEDVNKEWNHVVFESNAMAGVTNPTFLTFLKESNSGLKWRYTGPPQVQSVFPGISNVSCSFVACLDAP